MSNTDPTKNYNRWAIRTQPKTTIDEQHGPNQKLQWMSNHCNFWLGFVSCIHCSLWLGPYCSSIVVFGWVRVAHKNYNEWAIRTQPKATMDEQHGPNQKLQWMSNTDPTNDNNGWATRTPTSLVGSVLLIHCSFWLGPYCSFIVVFGWVRVAHLL
jgi:hypothetical protein